MNEMETTYPERILGLRWGEMQAIIGTALAEKEDQAIPLACVRPKVVSAIPGRGEDQWSVRCGGELIGLAKGGFIRRYPQRMIVLFIALAFAFEAYAVLLASCLRVPKTKLRVQSLLLMWLDGTFRSQRLERSDELGMSTSPVKIELPPELANSYPNRRVL